MDMKFDYVVSFYFGARNNKQYTDRVSSNKYFFVEKHVEYLSTCNKDNLRKVVFCFNLTSKDNPKEIEEIIENKFKTIDVEVVCFFRHNTGFSYGAWNEYIILSIEESDQPDYYFCIEEDYISNHQDSIEIFISKCNKEYSYICCKSVSPDTEEGKGYPPHASIPHGVFFANSCKQVYDKHNTVFYINSLDNNYEAAWDTQINLYQYFTEDGYKIGDILDEYRVDFLCSLTNEVKIFGDETKLSLIVPILV